MKTYIWALPMRLFHWFMFLSLVCAYILGEEDELLNVHTAFGYAVVFFFIVPHSLWIHRPQVFHVQGFSR